MPYYTRVYTAADQSTYTDTAHDTLEAAYGQLFVDSIPLPTETGTTMTDDYLHGWAVIAPDFDVLHCWDARFSHKPADPLPTV